MKKYEKLLPAFILAALVVGVILGRWCVAAPGVAKVVVPVAAWLGTSFMNLLKMLVVPLVFSSLVSGVMNLGSGRAVGRLGGKTIGLYLITSLVAVVTGLLLVNWIRPGAGSSFETGVAPEAMNLSSGGGFADFINNIFPSNIIRSMADSEMLHIILFAILFGLFALRVPARSKEFLTDLFAAIFQVMMRMTGFLVKLAPLGVLGLVTREVARQADLGAIASSLGLFMLTVAIGLLFHAFATLPVLVKTFSGAHPFRHMKNMSTALLTAFTTASSNATLPLTMEAVEKRSGVSNRVSSFTLPLGATINMDGTALFECVAAIFLAQAYGVELGIGTQLIIVFTALVTSIGAAGIPLSSFVMLVVILTAVGLPLEGLSVLLAVDFILDMMRTTVNVWSDSCVTVIVAKSEGEKLNV